MPGASVQFDVRLGAPREHACQRVEHDLGGTVQRELMHLVQRQVHQSGRETFDDQAATAGPPNMLPTVLNSPSDTSEPKSWYWWASSGLPARRRRVRRQRLAPRVGTDARVDQAALEGARIGRGLEHERVFGHTRRTEVVAPAAHGHHQRVVAEAARRRDLNPAFIDERRDMHFATLAVEAGERADPESEAVPMCLCAVRLLVQADVHAAGCDLVQLGLPDVGALLIDQRDLGATAFAQTVAERGRQFEPARTSTHDDDAVQGACPCLGQSSCCRCT